MKRPKTKEPATTVPKGSLFGDIAAYFASVKTTVTLLFVLAAASILGTVIPQGLDQEQLRVAAHSFAYRIAIILDLHNVYRSWWFVLLLFLLFLNLLGCLLKRVPMIVAEWRSETVKNSFSFDLTDPRSPGDVQTVLTSAVGGLMKCSPREVRTRDGSTLTWIRDSIHLAGFPLIHVSIMTILVGGLIGLCWGVKGSLSIKEGDSESRFVVHPSGETRKLPFTVVVERFDFTRYPSGEPKEFRSDVRIVREGKPEVKDSIRVNHPLTVDGVSLYQSSYDLVGVKRAKLLVEGGPQGPSEVAIEPKGSVRIPESEYELRYMRVDPGSTPKGPFLDLAVSGPGHETRALRLFKKDPEATKLGDIRLRFLDFDPQYVTGLQVGRDPGTPLVWVGSLLLVAGFMLVLFTNHRGLRVEVLADGAGSSIRVSGRSRRVRAEFRESVEKTVRDGLRN